MELADVVALSVTVRRNNEPDARTYTFSGADLREKFSRLPWVARSFIAGALQALKNVP